MSNADTTVPDDDIGDERRPSPQISSKSPQLRRGDQNDAGDRKKDHADDHQENDDSPADDKPASGGLKGSIRKHPIAILVCLGLIVIGAIAGTAWYLHTRHFESTDDAFIDGRSVLISPQVMGSIVSVNVTDNQVVKAGDLLAKIDPRDYQAAVDQAAAQIRQSEATAKNLEAQVAAQRAQIEQAAKQVTEAQAAFNFAQDENKRYQELVQKGAGTVQRAQQAESDFTGKRASLDAAVAAKTVAERQVDVLDAQIVGAMAQLDQNKAQKNKADADLSRTEMRATVEGRIAKLTAAVGALASPGQSIMILVPLNVWVTANFKESQLADMKPGQPVDISIDAFGRSFPGKIDSVQAGSGTAFSLLPAENATGNYVKVVQRVPVKIVFDKPPEVELGPGMSVVPTVTVRP